MDNNQRGIWSESVAMATLIAQGWEVYVGFGNTSCDLIGIKDGVINRIEVKSASPSTMPGKWVVASVKPEKFDTLLVVYPDGTVEQDPPRDKVYRNQ